MLRKIRIPRELCGVVLGLIPGAFGKYSDWKCDKYCFASCEFGPEFSDCVSANVDCTCITKVSPRNPFLIFIFFGVFIFISILYCMFRRSCRERPTNRSVIVAHPVIPTTGPGAYVNPSYYPERRPQPQPQRPAQAMPSPSPAPYIISLDPKDTPPDYLPPPAYNEVALNIDRPKL